MFACPFLLNAIHSEAQAGTNTLQMWQGSVEKAKQA